MIVGLYDIDLWHRGKSYPNLELMKTFKYLYDKNETVIMMRPNENIERFSKIIYFKDNEKTILPKTLNVYGDKKDIYGYGFYKKNSPLKPEIAAVPPSYFPYDAWVNKLKAPSDYDRMKSSSYIRLETKDFVDYKPNRTYIYIADHNFLYQENAEDFLQEYKRTHCFNFIHSLVAKEESTAYKFIRYSSLFNRRIIIDFRYNEDFFFNNYKEKVIFPNNKYDNESELNYLLRMTKIAIWFKKNEVPFQQSIYPTQNKIDEKIYQWAKDNRFNGSFYEYYQNDEKILSLADKQTSELRLLLKSKPSSFKSSDLDLSYNL